jgi:hypothetical protein
MSMLVSSVVSSNCPPRLSACRSRAWFDDHAPHDAGRVSHEARPVWEDGAASGHGDIGLVEQRGDAQPRRGAAPRQLASGHVMQLGVQRREQRLARREIAALGCRDERGDRGGRGGRGGRVVHVRWVPCLQVLQTAIRLWLTRTPSKIARSLSRILRAARTAA